jgi:hypothetical protein
MIKHLGTLGEELGGTSIEKVKLFLATKIQPKKEGNKKIKLIFMN